mgnify:FL=1|jgi:hypothetical protein
MKLGIANIEQLPWNVRTAIEDLEVGVQSGWGRQHVEDGSHSDITGTSVDLTSSGSIAGYVSTGGARRFARTVGLSPAQIGANTNNYNPLGLEDCHFLRINSDQARNLTGVVVDDVERWRELRIINVGSHTITMKHNDSNSTAAYRFACSGGSDHSLVSAGIATCLYDPHSANWRVY